MTTSALRFHGEFIDVEDRALRELIKAVAYHLREYANDDAATADWLVEACACWMDAHEAFPPGLRDLDLGEVLTTPGRVAGWTHYLRWLKRSAAPSHAYDAETARRVIERVLTKWGAPPTVKCP